MIDWQVTATTMYCDSLGEDTTILVYSDWSVKCTGYQKYIENPTRETSSALKRRSKKLRKELKCTGLGCESLKSYLDKLKSEENTK